MKNEITIILRAFPVIAHDHRTGREEALTITEKYTHYDGKYGEEN